MDHFHSPLRVAVEVFHSSLYTMHVSYIHTSPQIVLSPTHLEARNMFKLHAYILIRKYIVYLHKYQISHKYGTKTLGQASGHCSFPP